MSWSKMQLVKAAAYGGVFLATSGFLFQWMVGQRLRKTDHYKLAVANFMEHKSLIDYMGEPIGFGSVDLTDRAANWATEEAAQFTVPVKGSKVRGEMKFEASRDPSNTTNRWQLDKLSVHVDDRPNDRVHVPIKYPTFTFYEMRTGQKFSETLE